MREKRLSRVLIGTALLLGLVAGVQTQAAYVTPKIGGAQLGHMQAPMIMPEVSFDGAGIHVLDANGLPWPAFPWSQAPVLRPLVAPDTFDANQLWAVLIGKAYNFQYGWDSAQLDPLTYPFPPGSAIWVKVLSQSPELTTYFRDGAYAPLFGTPGADGKPSSDIWLWDKRMHHNTYAVPDSLYGRLSADYKVYLGDEVTGDEFADANGRPLYGSALVTLRWLRPCPCALQGDINSDCVVDANDLLLLAKQWMHQTCSSPDWCDECDLDRSGAVDMDDMNLLMKNWEVDCRQSKPGAASAP